MFMKFLLKNFFKKNHKSFYPEKQTYRKNLIRVHLFMLIPLILLSIFILLIKHSQKQKHQIMFAKNVMQLKRKKHNGVNCLILKV